MSIRRDDLDAGKVDLADVIDKRRAPMRPYPPGDVLRMEFLKPMKLSAYRLALEVLGQGAKRAIGRAAQWDATLGRSFLVRCAVGPCRLRR